MPETHKGSLLEKFVPVLLLVTVGLAFAVGLLWQKVMTLEKGVTVSNKPGSQAQPPSVNGKLSADQAKKLPPITASDHIRGPKDAQVFLIEYSDLQCPFCRQFHPTAKQALDAYKGKLAWVYRHFPLDTIHPKARPAANAAECVANLGGEDSFWKFVDAVFANQETALTDTGLPDTAAKVGVDSSSFSSCFSAKKFESIVDGDVKGGNDAGVNGTPGNFIVNKKGEVWVIPGAVPYDSLKAVIDEALKG